MINKSSLVNGDKAAVKKNRDRKGPAGFLHDIKNNPLVYLMMLPAIAYSFIFYYATYPFLLAAFQDYKIKSGLFGSEFVGLKNFNIIFANNTIYEVIYNTLFLNFLFITFATITALILALVFNEVKGRMFSKVSVSIILFPRFLSWTVIAFVVYALFGTSVGLVNRIIESFGFERVNWYNSPQYWPAILTIMKTWKIAGMKTIMFLSALTAIDPGIYEAATIDGATRPQQIRRITLPLLAPTICVLVLLDVGKMFQGDFGMIYALIGDNGMLYPTTDVIDTYVFRMFRSFGSISQSVAIGLFQAVFGFILVFGVNTVTRKFFREGALF